MSRTYGTPHIAVYIYQPLKWQATFVLALLGRLLVVLMRIIIKNLIRLFVISDFITIFATD